MVWVRVRVREKERKRTKKIGRREEQEGRLEEAAERRDVPEFENGEEGRRKLRCTYQKFSVSL